MTPEMFVIVAFCIVLMFGYASLNALLVRMRDEIRDVRKELIATRAELSLFRGKTFQQLRTLDPLAVQIRSYVDAMTDVVTTEIHDAIAPLCQLTETVAATPMPAAPAIDLDALARFATAIMYPVVAAPPESDASPPLTLDPETPAAIPISDDDDQPIDALFAGWSARPPGVFPTAIPDIDPGETPSAFPVDDAGADLVRDDPDDVPIP